MPFQSEKQRRYLWANEPEIAREWTDKYGSRVKKDMGGIMDAWGKHATASEAMKLMNQPDYHQKAGYNFMQNFPNTPNWLANTLATGYQYGSEGFKALKGGTDFSDAMARAKEESRLNKLGIQGLGFDMGEYENFMQNYNTANDISSLPRSSSIWDAIKNEFSGSAEAAIPDKYTSAQGVDVNNIRDLIAKSNMQKMMNASYSNVPEALDTSRFKGVYEGPGQGDEAGNYYSTGEGITEPNFLQRLGQKLGMTQVSDADRTANEQFMQQQGIGRDPQTGRMIGGDFAGKNAPGTSGWGSANFGEMAQSWMDKYGEMAYKTNKMKEKKARIAKQAEEYQRQKQIEREQTIKDYSTWTSPTGRDHPGTGGIGSPESKKGGAPGTSKGQASWKGYQGGLADLWPR